MLKWQISNFHSVATNRNYFLRLTAEWQSLASQALETRGPGKRIENQYSLKEYFFKTLTKILLFIFFTP